MAWHRQGAGELSDGGVLACQPLKDRQGLAVRLQRVIQLTPLGLENADVAMAYTPGELAN